MPSIVMEKETEEGMGLPSPAITESLSEKREGPPLARWKKRCRLQIEEDEELQAPNTVMECLEGKVEDEVVDEEEDEQDSICAICDDGGDILCCDGPCMRSFHATKLAASKSTSQCSSLGLRHSELEEMAEFYCLNCKYSQHQCFACGKLGASEGKLKEVILCDVALCGRFYHPDCISVCNENSGENRMFTCPMHRCLKCGEGEGTDNEDDWLYVCRRCPTAWHKRCIKDKINFDEDDEDTEGEIRGWKLGSARFLYCMKHPLVEDLGTPERNHLRFPRHPKPDKQSEHQTNKRIRDKDNSSSHVQKDGKMLEGASKAASKVKNCTAAATKLARSMKENSAIKKNIITSATCAGGLKMPSYESREINHELDIIILSTKKEITADSVRAKLTFPSTVGSKTSKNLQLSKLDSLLRAFYRALEMLKNNGREKAAYILPYSSLVLLENALDPLKVYLAPFLHGTRYTSYGRHFTMVEKLKQIVEKLRWYVKSEDMIVDFSCGTNDFSVLLHEELTKSGKFCKYKNFDILPAQNDFCFERRDWMSVAKEDLSPGDKLIVGLNPPFGFKAQMASDFSFQAAKFQPKIIILIVPKETKRLESAGYVLLWEDRELLRGESFYLAGSIDVNNNPMKQSNINPPPLYFWSRRDWAPYHKKIAARHGHLSYARDVQDLIHNQQDSYPGSGLQYVPHQAAPALYGSSFPCPERSLEINLQRSADLQMQNAGTDDATGGWISE